MKITKKILPTVLMIVLGFFAVQAQRTDERPPMDPEKMAEKQTAKMTGQLSLDEKQAEQVKAINLKYAQMQKGKMEETKAEREARRAEHQKIQEAKKAELKQVLTAEQYAQLEKAQAERMDRKGQHKNGHKGRPKGAAGKNKDLSPEQRSGKQTNKMVEKLGLDEKQAQSLQQVNLDFANKREALLKDNKEERTANKEAMKKLKDEQKAAIEKILTPEQLKQWEEMKDERGGKTRKGKGGDDGRM